MLKSGSRKKGGQANACQPQTSINLETDGPRVACAALPNDLRNRWASTCSRVSVVEGALPTLSRQWQTGKFSKDNRVVPYRLPRGKSSLRSIERCPACRVSAWWGEHVLLPAYFSTMVLDYDPWSQLGLECCPLHDAGYHRRLSPCLQRYAWDRGKSNLYLHSSLIDFPTNFWRKELFLFWNRKKKRNSPESCIIPSHWLFYKPCVFHRSLSWNNIESKKSSFLSFRGWFEPIVRAINQPFTRDLCWIINIVFVPRII